MGNEASKKNIPDAKNMVTDPSSYDETVRKHSSDLKLFDANLQSHLKQFLKTIDGGESPSLNSLMLACGCFVSLNQEAVQVILDYMKDILEDNGLSEFVKEYFDNSLNTLRFFNELEKCLLSARDNTLPVLGALRQFDKETEKAGDRQIATTTLEKALKDFKDAGNPFTEEFFDAYESVYNQQKDMLEKLEVKKEELDKKLKRNGNWRYVTRAIFGVTVASVVICTVVAAYFYTPAAVSLGAAALNLIEMGIGSDLCFKVHLNPLKGQKEVISSAHCGTGAAIKELESIQVAIDALEIKMKSLMRNVDCVIEHDAVKVAIEDSKNLLDSVSDLRSQTDTCRTNIARARGVVLQRITMLEGRKSSAKSTK